MAGPRSTGPSGAEDSWCAGNEKTNRPKARARARVGSALNASCFSTMGLLHNPALI